MKEHIPFSRRDFLRLSLSGMAASMVAACVQVPVDQASSEGQEGSPTVEDRELIVWYFAEVGREETPDDNLWHFWMRHHMDEFEPRHPGLKIVTEARGWDADLRTALLTAIAGGVTPDIAHGEAYVREFALLDAFAALPDELIEKFPYGPIAGSLVDGKLYGVPAMSGTFAVMVNTQVLEEAGIDPDSEPQTWDEYLAMQEAVNSIGKSGAYIWGPDPAGGYGSAMRTMPFVNQTGALMGTDEGVPTFNDPLGIQAYEFIQRENQFAANEVTFQAEGEPGATKLLTDGQIAFMVGWTNNVTGLGQMDPKPPVKMIPIPVVEGGQPGNVVLGNITYSALKGSQHLEDAVAFLSYLTEDTAQLEMTKHGIFVPATISALQNPDAEHNGGYGNAPEMARVVMDALVNGGDAIHAVPPWPKNGTRIWQQWNDAFSKMLLEGADPKTVLDELQASAESLLA